MFMETMQSNLSAAEMSKVLSRALKHTDLIQPDDTAILFYDQSFIEARIKNLQAVFPANTLHAIAVKANPLSANMVKLKALGTGVEVASLPELYMAEKAGFLPENIVFDSPCKTNAEIEYALKLGVYINADSFAELDRIAERLKSIPSQSKIGLRINPQVGSGTIETTSVAGWISKFGVPITENIEKIKEYYLQYKWLTGIHVHIGSQGCPVPLLVKGIRKVLDLAMEINLSLNTASVYQIETFDIGGGLPVSYHSDKSPVTMANYQHMLAELCPELFNGQFRLITEFGRYIYANAGWVASKIEYIKREPYYNILITHVGADLFLRKCYNPTDWHHEISITDSKGKLKNGTDIIPYIVAGPLCFAGDVLAKDIVLPYAQENDFILIHDAGAYTLSMWSRYNSRQMPKVIGYTTGEKSFEILKKREDMDGVQRFWV